MSLSFEELRSATATGEVHAIDNAFRGQLDGLRDAVLQEMQHDFDDFVRSHDSKFTATRSKGRAPGHTTRNNVCY